MTACRRAAHVSCSPCAREPVAAMDAVRFVRAKADKIAALKDYRGKARPNFLFYLAGEKVEELDGADLPKIQKTILEKAPKTS